MDKVSKVSEFVKEISIGSTEQVTSIDQTNQALQQIDQVTQSNTANAEESASASEELSSQAVQLKQLISRFKLKQQYIDSANRIQSASVIRPSHYESPSANDGGNGKGKSKSSINPTQVIGLDDQDFGDF